MPHSRRISLAQRLGPARDESVEWSQIVRDLVVSQCLRDFTRESQPFVRTGIMRPPTMVRRVGPFVPKAESECDCFAVLSIDRQDVLQRPLARLADAVRGTVHLKSDGGLQGVREYLVGSRDQRRID